MLEACTVSIHTAHAGGGVADCFRQLPSILICIYYDSCTKAAQSQHAHEVWNQCNKSGSFVQVSALWLAVSAQHPSPQNPVSCTAYRAKRPCITLLKLHHCA